MISVDNQNFSISTYSIVDGKTSQIDTTFTIEKTVDRTPKVTNTAAKNTQNGAENDGAPQTGDNTDLTVTGILAAISALGLAAVGLAALKEKRSRASK